MGLDGTFDLPERVERPGLEVCGNVLENISWLETQLSLFKLL